MSLAFLRPCVILCIFMGCTPWEVVLVLLSNFDEVKELHTFANFLIWQTNFIPFRKLNVVLFYICTHTHNLLFYNWWLGTICWSLVAVECIPRRNRALRGKEAIIQFSHYPFRWS